MIKLNKKIVITILILFFLSSVISFLTKGEARGVEFGIISFVLFFEHSKITKYDFIFLGGLVLGVVMDFVNIFYKNIYIPNVYSIIICGLAIIIYLKEMSNNNEKN